MKILRNILLGLVALVLLVCVIAIVTALRQLVARVERRVYG